MQQVYCTIQLKFSFAAAHYLPNHKGLCNNVHGHNYKLEISLSGSAVADSKREDDGMLIEFGEAKKIVQLLVVDRFDHQLLNEDPLFKFHPPTTELLAYRIFELLQARLTNLYKVKVVETDRNSASVTIDQWRGHV